MKLTIGAKAPEFSLPDQNGNMHSLSDYRGTWVLLYFYPKDNTTGCVAEACTIRDHYAEFKKTNTTVLGVSVDSVASHKKFEKNHDLPFVLLADEKKEVVKMYGVWTKKKFMGREYMGIVRQSFLIDPKGNLTKIYERVKPQEHAEEVLTDRKMHK